MALFVDLHDVGQVLSEHIQAEVGILDVQPGPPRDASATTAAAARLTLLYATPQPGHRNDQQVRLADGKLRPPPLSLTCVYLVTTTGADSDDPIAAQFALGRIMTLYHDDSELALPLSAQGGGPPGGYSDLGEGPLGVVQMPMSLEQIDKVWTSVDVGIQPWALLEVSPVQLVSQADDADPAPMVRPGGLGFDIRSGTRPVILRVTPEVVRQGGRVRIDAYLRGAVDGMDVAGIEVPAGDSSLTIPPEGSPLLLALDDGGLEALEAGAHPITLRAQGMASRRGTLRIAAATAPAVDAPAAPHDPANDLVLGGANLADAQEVLLWPDTGVGTPSDIVNIVPSAVAAGSLTVPSSGSPGLEDLPAGRGPWRLAVRVGDHVYTPYVVVEVTE